ncbi:spermidine synthase [Sugiyamaella lignohabitans]|uniref:Spermidine synthase n=1 Tax=Sugiyamaella lignohabitans TaxID=796027 RepID=A0A161HFJ6_9ASCO|nr:spermidine synthase [Sugiyamaella lignohabitans]ANB11311.1 spermidine synthase [Sugiyamaella lignohabitans]
MIAHIPLNAHPNPKRVLVVGGGDGGVLREVTKHECVEKIDIVEIDDSVVRLAKQYLPDMAKGYNDPRITLHITDGFDFLRTKTAEYDVIISDTSDPEGPAEVLFQEEYFRLLDNALTEKGVISMMASENVWLKVTVLEKLRATCKNVFPTVEYAYTCVPTYTSGQLGLMICSKDAANDVTTPTRLWDREVEASINRYYNREIHRASFVIPTFARRYLA